MVNTGATQDTAKISVSGHQILPTGGHEGLATDGHSTAVSDRPPEVRERGIPALIGYPAAGG